MARYLLDHCFFFGQGSRDSYIAALSSGFWALLGTTKRTLALQRLVELIRAVITERVEMDISIDMLSVGNADAIILWWKDAYQSSVAVIDGGNPGDGEKIISHLDRYILPNANKAAPDLIISTHSDNDHIGGLTEVVERYGNAIGQVWVHDVRNHIDENYYCSASHILKMLLENKSHPKNTEAAINAIVKSFDQQNNFLNLVDSYGILRYEPYYGLQFGSLNVLGPSKEFYSELVSEFKDITEHLVREIALKSSALESVVVKEEAEAAFPCPIVDEANDCSAENESSVVLELKNGAHRYFFTGDAGVRAMTSISERVNIGGIYWLDIPHHGSRNNLTSELIATMKPEVAYVSAKGDNKHPRRALVNCFKRHSTRVYSTHKSGSLWHLRGDFPERPSYSTAEPL